MIILQLDSEQLKSLIQNAVKKAIKGEPACQDLGNQIFTIDEASEFLNLAKPTIYRLVSERKIPHCKKGKRLYFSKERLIEWVESGEVRTQAQIKKEVNNG